MNDSIPYNESITSHGTLSAIAILFILLFVTLAVATFAPRSLTHSLA